MKRYNAIDLARIIAAVLVICVHTDPLFHYSSTGNYFLVTVLARLAVPFFFVTSGFFFGNKIKLGHSSESELPILLPVIKRLIALYIAWTMMYLPIQIYAWTRSGGSWSYWLTYLQKLFFEGSYYTLWYLTGLIFAMAFSYLLFKIFKPGKVLLITLMLYIVGTLLQSYYDVFESESLLSWYYSIFLTTRNGLFFGSLFVSLGIYMAHHKQNLSKKWNSRLFILFFILLTIEAFNLEDLDFTKGSGMWLMLVPTVFFLFKILQKIHLRDRRIYQYLRPLSFLLYVSHGLFLIIFASIFKVDSLLYFSIVFICTCLFSISIIYFSARLEILKRLY